MKYTRYSNLYTLDGKSKEELSDVVTQIIMDEYESILIERCVKMRYAFLDLSEQQKVVENAKRLAEGSGGEGFPSHKDRQKIIYGSILKYLEEEKEIVPSGFVDFRMRNEYYYTENMVHKGADMFFEEKEYEEFTYLLSLFVSEKESREEVVHVLWENNTITLLNKRRRDVTKKYERDFVRAAKEKDIGQEDIAISAIIAAAPKKLVLHTPPKTPLAETLKKIFGDRCVVCNGCNVCKKS